MTGFMEGGLFDLHHLRAVPKKPILNRVNAIHRIYLSYKIIPHQFQSKFPLEQIPVNSHNYYTNWLNMTAAQVVKISN